MVFLENGNLFSYHLLLHLIQARNSGTCSTCSLCVIKRYNAYSNISVWLCDSVVGRCLYFSMKRKIFLLILAFCEQGEVQYFIGVQLDGSEHVEPRTNRIAEDTAQESEILVSFFWNWTPQLWFRYNILSSFAEVLSWCPLSGETNCRKCWWCSERTSRCQFSKWCLNTVK